MFCQAELQLNSMLLIGMFKICKEVDVNKYYKLQMELDNREWSVGIK